MKETEITGDNLEDLLVCDDLFLDYFNAFLVLPVFAQAVYYDGLSGTFVAVSQNSDTLPQTSVSDEHREKMIDWAKENRLPLFLKMSLYREYKLCKLLLKALDDRRSAARNSAVRGYSRQSGTGYDSSLSNSADNSANVGELDSNDFGWDWNDVRKSSLFKHMRPGSRAYSVPTGMAMAEYREQTADTTASFTSDSDTSSSTTRKTGKTFSAKDDKKQSKKNAAKHSVSVKRNNDNVKEVKTENITNENGQENQENQEGSLENEVHEDDGDELEDELEGQLVKYEEDGGSEDQTASDMKDIESKHQMPLQDMKTQLLGSVNGMQSFKQFLKDTSGENLLNFWLACEQYKDYVNTADENNASVRNRLFRDIQDRFRSIFTAETKQQITNASGISMLSDTIFLRAQYDTLRRLRSYWVLRYIIHKERLGELKVELTRPRNIVDDVYTRAASSVCLFPMISVVNSIPVNPDMIMQMVTDWQTVSKGGHSALDEHIQSVLYDQQNSSKRSLKHNLLTALYLDLQAGGPFQVYLDRINASYQLSSLLFWEDLNELRANNRRKATDRHLGLSHCWEIFNKYIAKDGIFSLGVSPADREPIHRALLNAKDTVDVAVFNKVKENAVDRLCDIWVAYLKDDLEKFMEADELSQENVKENVEIYWDDSSSGRLIIKRTSSAASDDKSDDYIQSAVVVETITSENRPTILSENRPTIFSENRPTIISENRPKPQSSEEETDSGRESSASSVDEVRLKEERKKARKRAIAMEKARKQAVRAAQRRLKELMKQQSPASKQGKSSQDQQETDSGDRIGSSLSDNGVASFKESRVVSHLGSTKAQNATAAPPPTFVSYAKNAKIVGSFKKYLTESENKEAQNELAFYMDIESYLESSRTNVKSDKKTAMLAQMYKTYIENQSKKKVTFADRIDARLKQEQERPRTATLRQVQQHLRSKLEDSFATYIKERPDDLMKRSLSKFEAALQSGNITFVNKKNKSGSSDDSEAEDILPEDIDEVAFENSVKSFLSGVSIDRKCISLTLLRQTFSTCSVKVSSSQKKLFRGQQGSLHQLRIQATNEDRAEFLDRLIKASTGYFDPQMQAFYKYLSENGETEGRPYADRDLLFFLEAQKFKEAAHLYGNEDVIRQKAQAMLETFIECPSPPAIQISISTDVQQRTLRAVQKMYSSKEPTPGTFDEPQLAVFKELLPFWAAFVRFNVYKSKEELRAIEKKKTESRLQKKLRKKAMSKKKVDEVKRRSFSDYTRMVLEEGLVPLRQHRRRMMLQEMNNWKNPSPTHVHLPHLPKVASLTTMTFSLVEGLRWRDDEENVQESDPQVASKRQLVSASTTTASHRNASASSISNPLKSKQTNSSFLSSKHRRQSVAFSNESSFNTSLSAMPTE